MRTSTSMGVGAIALMLFAAQATHAQSDRGGRIEGTVTDSVHARPLAGAHVVAVGTGSRSELRAEATTDSIGRYRIDSLPLGRYIVGFESALLDSLEVALTPREATVTPGNVATLDLALPSAAKLRAAVCPDTTLPAGTGVIYGHVVSAETENPLAGITIAMAWQDLTVERKKRLRAIKSNHSEAAVTDENGWYRMCGVPTGAWVSMQAQHEDRAGAVLRTRVDDTLGIAIQHLSFSTSGETNSDSLAGAPVSGTATLTGFVRSAAGTPVASAEVRVRDTRGTVRTDALGAFTLRGLPAGTQQLEVRRIGYAIAEVPLELRGGATVTKNVVLRRIVSLDSMVIVASRPKYPEFYAHKSSGFGRFLGPEAIAMERVTRTTDIIRKIPGFMVQENGYRSTVVSAQGAGFGKCPATIVVDGMRVLEYPPTVNDIHWTSVAAIEAYPASMAPFAPPEYGIGGCGGIVIWTKR